MSAKDTLSFTRLDVMELCNLLNELKIYKDFDKNEKIKNLTCKPGDNIYIIDLSAPDGYLQEKIKSIEIYKDSIYLRTQFKVINTNNIDKDYFLLKEKAVKAVKRIDEYMEQHEMEKANREKAEMQEMFSQGDYES